MAEIKTKKMFSGILIALTVVLAIFCVCRIFFIDWYTISGSSMYPTYKDGQTVFALKIGEAKRFDAVVVDSTDLGLDGMDTIFKRVVAVEGDEIWSEDGVLVVFYDGEEHRFDNEKYGGGELSKIPLDIPRQTVPEGCVFLLGDNRQTSIDSRFFGCVEKERIIAVVL